MADRITMQFPPDTAYMGTIRLAVSGIASTMDYPMDDIEDVRSCVSEACLLLLAGQKCSALDLDIEAGDSLFVTVKAEDVQADAGKDFEDFAEEISRIMLEQLSDESTIVEEDGLITEVSFDKRRRNQE